MKSENVSKKLELKHRIYVWTLSLVKTIDVLSHSTSNDVIARQLIRSGTSVCANYIEGQAASSRKDFTNYLHIALKSANESNYWLAMLRDLKKIDGKMVEVLLNESQQIANILAASVMTLKNKK